jgi:predicted phage tail protein
MIGFKIDAEQFSSIPSRSYLVDGMYVQVPSNYNPELRMYTGVWDGSFKIGYTNNPAWILRDLMLNKRYGLGEFIKPSNINVGKLYTIARYCDGLVTDGAGGFEPRFTINTVIQAQRDAYKVIQDICSVFRGMAYWSGGMVQVTQDSPADPVYLYNNANVVDGMFNRVGSARKDRHSVVHVTWNDPLDQYKQKIEYVEDKNLIDKIGYRKMDTVAFGCTSRAQAHRIGLWILYTESVETNIMTFDVGLQGLQCAPGDIVKIHDQYKAGKREGGRLKAATRNGCTLDAPTQIAAGSVIAIQMPNGKFEELPVATTGLVTDVVFTGQLSTVPMANAVWILTEINLVPQLARVVGVAQSETENQYVISVVDHNPSKYGSIEQGLQLQDYPTTILDPTNSTPESLLIEEVTYLVAPGQIGTRLDVSWEGKSPFYFVSWRSNNGTGATGWTQETSNKASFTLPNVQGQTIYDFSIVAQAATGKLSTPLEGTYTTLGTLNPPSPPTNLTAVGNFKQISLAWINSTVVDFDFVEIFENTEDNVDTAYYYDRTPGNTFIRDGVPGLMKYWYWVRTVNKRGMRSAFNSSVGTSAIAGVIAVTDLDVNLAEIIEDISGIGDTILDQIEHVTSDLNDRVSESEALAAAARAGNSIEELLRNDTNFQIKEDAYKLEISLTDDINAKIAEVNQVAVSDREAVAQALVNIDAQFATSNANFVQEQQVRASADAAQATQITGLTATTAATNAALVSEQTARANADSAQVTDITSLKAKTDATNASLATEQTVRATADSALSTSLTALNATVSGHTATIASEITVRANADSALGTRIDSVVANTATNTAAIQTEASARTTADSALSTQINSLIAKTDTTNAAILSETTTRANGDSALSTLLNTVSATANGANVSAQQNTSALATTNGKLSAFWNMKLQMTAGGKLYSAGMGIGIENTAQGITQSQIAMQADRFVVINPAVGNDFYPFQIIGGVVYINTAMIASATITNAMIQDASITYAKIGVGQIGTAHIGDATITSAKIADLSVTTLKIGNEAVIVPRWAGYAPAFGCNGSSQTPLSMSFYLPQAGMVFATYYAGFGSYGTQIYSYNITINGSVTASSSANWSDSSITLGSGQFLAAGWHTINFNITGEPGVVLSYQNLMIQGIMR